MSPFFLVRHFAYVYFLLIRFTWAGGTAIYKVNVHLISATHPAHSSQLEPPHRHSQSRSTLVIHNYRYQVSISYIRPHTQSGPFYSPHSDRSCTSCTNQRKFDSSKSSTYIPVDQTAVNFSFPTGVDVDPVTNVSNTPLSHVFTRRRLTYTEL